MAAEGSYHQGRVHSSDLHIGQCPSILPWGPSATVCHHVHHRETGAVSCKDINVLLHLIFAYCPGLPARVSPLYPLGRHHSVKFPRKQSPKWAHRLSRLNSVSLITPTFWMFLSNHSPCFFPSNLCAPETSADWKNMTHDSFTTRPSTWQTDLFYFFFVAIIHPSSMSATITRLLLSSLLGQTLCSSDVFATLWVKVHLPGVIQAEMKQQSTWHRQPLRCALPWTSYLQMWHTAVAPTSLSMVRRSWPLFPSAFCF